MPSDVLPHRSVRVSELRRDVVQRGARGGGGGAGYVLSPPPPPQ